MTKIITCSELRYRTLDELDALFRQLQIEFGRTAPGSPERASVLARARRQLKDNRTDACVANGRAYGEGFGVVTPARKPKHCADMRDLFEVLEGLLQRRQDRENS